MSKVAVYSGQRFLIPRKGTVMAESENPSRDRLSVSDLLLVALFGVILTVTLVAAFFRYAVNWSLFWSDEVVRYLFVWFTLFGAALALRDRHHIRVEYFVEQMPPGVRRIVEMAGLLLVTGFNLILVVLGTVWAYETRTVFTPASGLPLSLVFYAALPATAALNVWFCVRRLRTGQYTEMDVGQNEDAID